MTTPSLTPDLTDQAPSVGIGSDALVLPPVLDACCGSRMFWLAVTAGSRLRDMRRQEVQALKKAHGIFSHHCARAGDWMALSMPECTAALSGYDLSDEEKTDAVALMAGYCRLLDEANMIEQGHRTEYDAVRALVDRLSANTKTCHGPEAKP